MRTTNKALGQQHVRRTVLQIKLIRECIRTGTSRDTLRSIFVGPGMPIFLYSRDERFLHLAECLVAKPVPTTAQHVKLRVELCRHHWWLRRRWWLPHAAALLCVVVRVRRKGHTLLEYAIWIGVALPQNL